MVCWGAVADGDGEAPLARRPAHDDPAAGVAAEPVLDGVGHGLVHRQLEPAGRGLGEPGRAGPRRHLAADPGQLARLAADAERVGGVGHGLGGPAAGRPAVEGVDGRLDRRLLFLY